MKLLRPTEALIHPQVCALYRKHIDADSPSCRHKSKLGKFTLIGRAFLCHRRGIDSNVKTAPSLNNRRPFIRSCRVYANAPRV